MKQWPPELVRLIQQFEHRINQLEEENKELKKRITYLENKLKAYENPHTPPSYRRFKNNNRTNLSGKRGAPPGHHGATRQRPEPDEIIPVTMDTCPQCGTYLGDFIDVESHTIEEIPPPQNIKVTRYDIHTYVCSGCGCKITATHKDCPRVGNLGIRLMTHITMMKFRQRGVLRRIQESLKEQHGFPLSPKGIHDVLLRVGDACHPEYTQLLQRIRTSSWKYTDETGMPVNGENWWLWIFRTNKDDVLTVIRPSRGKKVLEEILGIDDDVYGATVNDGWRSYQWLPVVQRCWAHLLREVDSGKDLTEHEQMLSEEMHRRFRLLKEFLGKDPPMKQRQQMKERWDKELSTFIDVYLEYNDTRVKAQYIKNGLGCWYTCLLYPGMQPTNNLGEQAIRDHVIMRKIIGTFRSEKGSENYQFIASLLATWKMQGKNMYEELENLLRRELCLSWS
jgi:transposase